MTSDYNFAGLTLGLPEHGKSTIARELAAAHLASGGWVFAHDPNRQFRDMCEVVDDAAALRARLAAAAAKGEAVDHGWSVSGDAAALRALAVEIGKAHNTAGDVRVPILLVVDESSVMGTSGSTHIGVDDNALLANRRHWGIGPLYNAQRPTALTEAFYTFSTDVWVFALPSEKWQRHVEENLALPPGSLAAMVGAPKFRYAHWRRGEGLV